VFAPPTENDTAAYIAAMVKHMGFPATQIFSLDTPEILAKWGQGIVRQEVGLGPLNTDWYSADLYLQAAKMALG